MTDPPAEFPAATWTTFDRYGRYGAIARALRANLGPGLHRVLDVGDGSGYLALFDPHLDVVCADIVPTPDPLPGTVRIAADGSRLPLPDRSFDAVVSSDALEHVPDDRRPEFLAEVARVSRDLVIVAAPFNTDGVAGAEELARRFVLLSTGAPQDQLDEHAERGLPDLAETIGLLERGGLTVASAGNGNLHDWLLFMLLKHQLAARPALLPLDTGYDIAYNLLLAGRHQIGPFYRYVIVGRRAAVPDLALPPIDPAAPDAIPLLSAFLAANVAEATRQDTAPVLQAIEHRVAVVESNLAAALSDLRGDVTHLNAKVDRALELLRHPLRAASRKIRRSDAE